MDSWSIAVFLASAQSGIPSCPRTGRIPADERLRARAFLLIGLKAYSYLNVNPVDRGYGNVT